MRRPVLPGVTGWSVASSVGVRTGRTVTQCQGSAPVPQGGPGPTVTCPVLRGPSGRTARRGAPARRVRASMRGETVSVFPATREFSVRRPAPPGVTGCTASTAVTVRRRTARAVITSRGGVAVNTAGEVRAVTLSVRRDGGGWTAVWSVSVVSLLPPVTPPLASVGARPATRVPSARSPAARAPSG